MTKLNIEKMADNILGIDLGTNSIGLSLRNPNISGNIQEQLECFTSVIFPSGVGKGKSGEFSYAAERTKHRSSRRLYQARRYRIWATLKLLIENGFCPLSLADLEQWSTYNKLKGLKRQYPIHATEFEQWVRLDFNGDGIADYSSPFELRAKLMEEQFDFSTQINKYKLGRALYHIAQHRGFKSSKGETIKEQEQNEKDETVETDLSEALKKSEEKKSGKLAEYMLIHNLPTVGCAYNHILKNGIRVRNSEYQAVRSQYKKEIEKIFEFQKGLSQECDFYRRIISEKKGEGTIFYKRPLRSQKGLVGRCTLEPSKPRCPISHPEFEKFRAWSLINNIRFGEDLKETLTLEQKRDLFRERFLLTRSSFKFEEIRQWIQRETFMTLDYKAKTINYKDKANVSGCPICARLKNLLGDNWEDWEYLSSETKTNKKTGEIKTITYTAEDLWHVCFSFEDPEYVESFAKDKLHFDDKQAKQLIRIFGSIQQGYGMLSLKAIKNINRFLAEGLIYADAVLLAKLPDIFKDKWDNERDSIVLIINQLIEQNRKQKQLFNIVNTLIANYKSLSYDDENQFNQRFADHNTEYQLQESDYSDIENVAIKAFGERTWTMKSEEERMAIIDFVAQLYQDFFSSNKRDYYKIPKIADDLAMTLHKRYEYLPEKGLKKIYHPSMIEFYAPATEQRQDDGRWIKLLGSPVIGALKNPMAMRVLHILRKRINAMLKDGIITGEDTRIVVETARELNDANMRWAIETYQREREAENKEYEKILADYYPNRDINNYDIDQIRLMCEQHEIPENGATVAIDANDRKKQKTEKAPIYKKDITKYRLWLEQGCRCLYTGKVINITNLFDENAFDIEHTIPRSLSFDDSLSNMTICDAHFNRTIKRNQLPSQLANYETDANGYGAILPRLQPWIDKVERLKDNVDFWKAQSRRAQDKGRKDQCIRQRHLWEMELKYWKNKVERFTMKEVTSGFRNNQLNDTRIITKYAYHYLRTVFNKVDVEKGKVTSNFRKILGIQSIDEKKSRDKHSHHAIDATTLTLIPSAAQRDKMIELFYKIQEDEKLGIDATALKKELTKEIRKCNLPKNISFIVSFIENNIIVNHISKDNTLTPAHRRKRIKGKVVPLRDAEGKIVYEKNADGSMKLNKYGHPIPKAKEWITGDSIRGQLHKESFFGAIKYPKTDKDGKPIRGKDSYVYDKDANGNDIISLVMRVPITSFTKEDEFKKIVDPSIKESIEKTIAKRKEEGKSFKTAIEEPMWLIDKDGHELKIDKNGHYISPIRHVRCKVAAGRGFFTKDKAIEVKRQTYPSRYDYKNTYYAQNDGNYLCLLYEGIKKGKVVRQFRFINYYDIGLLGIKKVNDIYKEPYFQRTEDGKIELKLSAIIKTGTHVIMWQESPDELESLTPPQLSRRLFVVYKFNLKGANCIYLLNHIEARNEIAHNEDYTSYDATNYQAKLTLVANGFNCLIENRDFKINDLGNIEWL